MSNGNSFRRDQRQQHRTQTRFANMRLQDYRRATQLERLATEQRRRAARAEADRQRQEAQRAEVERRRRREAQEQAEAEARRVREFLERQREEQERARLQAEALAQQLREAQLREAQRLEEQRLQQQASELATLLSKGWSPQLSTKLKEKYGDELGAEMSRQMRTKGIADERLLKREAESKIGRRQKAESEDDSFGRIGSGALNVKGKQVERIAHGTGKGFKAGDPARWHVHYDHVKWGTSGATRIDFDGRPKGTILEKLNAMQPPTGSLDRPSWDTCYQWIYQNL